MKTMNVSNGSLRYLVGKKVAEGDAYRTYLCHRDGEKQQCLLVIATSPEHNGVLDRWAYILRELKRKSDVVEEEYAKVKTKEHQQMNYDLQFPHVVDCFVCSEEGGRRVLVLAFRNVEDVTKLVPLGNLTRKNRRRVDLRTSVWIAGKLLKLLVFAHSEGFATALMSSHNLLIEPDKHYVLMFDWSKALMDQPGELSALSARNDIMGVARAALVALGSNLSKGVVPDTDDENRSYSEYLLWLAKGGTSNAKEAHQRFYEVVDSIWPREFYSFTTKPLS